MPDTPTAPPTPPKHRDLTGLDLAWTTLAAWDGRAADLRRADLTGADLTGAVLTDACLHGARIREGRLQGLRARGLAARDLDAEAADLSGADLVDADLVGAVLFEASLRHGQLAGALLLRADLRGADLRDADLTGADLSGADLRGARLDGVVLEGVRARGLRIDRGSLPEEVEAALREAGATLPGELAQQVIQASAPLVGRFARASGRWVSGTLQRQWANFTRVSEAMWSEGGRQLSEARDLQARLAEQRRDERRRIAAIAAARKERIRADAGRTGAAEAAARRLRTSGQHTLVDGGSAIVRGPTLYEERWAQAPRRSTRRGAELGATPRARLQERADKRQADADAEAIRRRAEAKRQARLAAEREARRLREEQERQEAEAARQAEEEAIRRAEEVRQAEEDARRLAEQETARANEAARRADALAEEEEKRQQAEEDFARQAAVARMAEDDARRLAAELETQRIAAIRRAEQRTARETEDARRKAEDALRRAADRDLEAAEDLARLSEQQARRQAESEARRRVEEERIAEEEVRRAEQAAARAEEQAQHAELLRKQAESERRAATEVARAAVEVESLRVAELERAAAEARRTLDAKAAREGERVRQAEAVRLRRQAEKVRQEARQALRAVEAERPEAEERREQLEAEAWKAANEARLKEDADAAQRLYLSAIASRDAAQLRLAETGAAGEAQARLEADAARAKAEQLAVEAQRIEAARQRDAAAEAERLAEIARAKTAQQDAERTALAARLEQEVRRRNERKAAERSAATARREEDARVRQEQEAAVRAAETARLEAEARARAEKEAARRAAARQAAEQARVAEVAAAAAAERARTVAQERAHAERARLAEGEAARREAERVRQARNEAVRLEAELGRQAAEAAARAAEEAEQERAEAIARAEAERAAEAAQIAAKQMAEARSQRAHAAKRARRLEAEVVEQRMRVAKGRVGSEARQHAKDTQRRRQARIAAEAARKLQLEQEAEAERQRQADAAAQAEAAWIQAEAARAQAEAERARAAAKRAEAERVEAEARAEIEARKAQEEAERARRAAAQANEDFERAEEARKAAAQQAQAERAAERAAEAARRSGAEARRLEETARTVALVRRAAFERVRTAQSLSGDIIESEAAPSVEPPPHAEPSVLRRLFQLLPGGRPIADVPDGAGVHLQGRDLRGMRLGARDWRSADLGGARLDTARLDGANLSGARLEDTTFDAARLQGANLTDAVVEGASFEGARLRNAVLRGTRGEHVRFVDADLRGADLRDARLQGADFTGADLRRTQLSGADLSGADLTAARLSDVDLAGACLDRCELDQADLAGTLFDGASVRDARVATALGLSRRDRESLARAGAHARDQSLEHLLGRFGSQQVRVAVAVFALGVGTYLGARYLADSAPEPVLLEQEAERLRGADPIAAASAYVTLAESSQRLADRVGYLVEAGDLVDQGGRADLARAHFARALEEAGDDPSLTTDVRLRAAASLARNELWVDVPEMVEPVLASQGQPSELRARAFILRLDATKALGGAVVATETALMASFASQPEVEADLRLAMAERRSTSGDFEAAVRQLEFVDGLELITDQRARALDVRARVLEQSGDLDAAAEAWMSLIEDASPGSHQAPSARLALADLRNRQGRAMEALALVERVLTDGGEDSLMARARLVEGRLHEKEGSADKARDAWQAVLALEEAEPEVVESARMSLAALLLAAGDEEAIAAALADLSDDAAASILIHARLGEARRHLDEAHPAEALDIYEAILEAGSFDRGVLRSAKAGQAECLAAMGETQEAVRIWREQLGGAPNAQERGWLELQLAHGLVQGGQLEEAEAAFESLAASEDPDVRFQGVLGQAELAQTRGEGARARTLYQQVVDRAEDPAFKVQALQELAELALESNQPNAAGDFWRQLLSVVEPGSSEATDARTALMSGLARQGKVDEALGLCTESLEAADPAHRASAAFACAEIHEQAGNLDEAYAGYAELHATETAEDLRHDVALGLARVSMDLGRPDEAVNALEAVLAEAESEVQRLPLLSALLSPLELAGDLARLNAVRQERDASARRRPELAGPILTESAQTARSAGRTDEAISLFKEALSLSATRSDRIATRLELADTLLEDQQIDDALVHYNAILDTEDVDAASASAARLGGGHAELQRGAPEAAIALLSVEDDSGTPQRRARIELLARAMVAAERPSDALTVWRRLAEAAGEDRATLAVAARGEADVLLATDQLDEALMAYARAEDVAPDPATRGWARLGRSHVLMERGDTDAALRLLAEARDSPDIEVVLQAHILGAQVHLRTEAWEDAFAMLEGVTASGMGAGWDATLVENRCAALAGLDRLPEAREEWKALVDRWPEDDEARLPAWLGLADLATASGDTSAARQLVQTAMEATDDPGYIARAEDLMRRLGP